MTSPRIPSVALAALIAVTGIAGLWSDMRAVPGIDFYQMWIGARMARETTDFYAPATRARMGEEYLRRAVTEEQSPRRLAVARFRRDLQVLSTPFLYLVFAPFRGTYERDLLLFQILMLLAFASWVALFARIYGYRMSLGVLLFAFLAVAFAPTRSDARTVNVNHLLILLLAIAALFTQRGRFALAGATLAFAALTKPYVAMIIPLTYVFWITRARWRDLAEHASGAAVAGAAGLIASSLYFRSGVIWLDWLREFRAEPQSTFQLDVGNIALAVVIRQLTGVQASAPLLALFGLITLVVAWRVKPRREADLLAIGLGCVLFQLGSPLVWVHHLLLSVPLIAYLLREGDRRRQLAAAFALALIAVAPWAALMGSMIQIAAAINVGLLMINVGLLIAFGAALCDLGAQE